MENLTHSSFANLRALVVWGDTWAAAPGDIYPSYAALQAWYKGRDRPYVDSIGSLPHSCNTIGNQTIAPPRGRSHPGQVLRFPWTFAI